MRELSRHLTRSTCGQDYFQDNCNRTRRLLRGEETAAGRAVRVLPALLDDKHDSRAAQAVGVGKESARTAVSVHHQSEEGLRL